VGANVGNVPPPGRHGRGRALSSSLNDQIADMANLVVELVVSARLAFLACWSSHHGHCIICLMVRLFGPCTIRVSVCRKLNPSSKKSTKLAKGRHFGQCPRSNLRATFQASYTDMRRHACYEVFPLLSSSSMLGSCLWHFLNELFSGPCTILCMYVEF
jgi:hypothetical protein